VIYHRFSKHPVPRPTTSQGVLESGDDHASVVPAPHSKFALLALAVVLWPLIWPSSWSVEGRRECRVPPGEDPFRVLHAPTCDEPIDAYHQRVRELVRDLEPGAVLFTGWTLLYPDYYVAHVEMGRTDLIFVQDYPQADCFELADSAVEYAEEMAGGGHAVYFTHVVAKIAKKFELAKVQRGRDKLFRLGAKKINSPGCP
jgi:hypothetical protein